MTEEQNKTKQAASKSRPRKPRMTAKQLLVRLWALVILAMVIGTGYLAISYLVHNVFAPAEVPPRFLEWESKLSPEILLAEHEATPPRAPMGHYHGVNFSFHATPYLGCVTAGCHSPLPHQKRKEIRAFANLHATFMSCQMCHEKEVASPMKAEWIDLVSGKPLQGPPALFALLDLLGDDQEFKADQPFTKQVLALLTEAMKFMNDDPLIDHLRVQLVTTSPGSPVWRMAMTELQRELHHHERGDYGAHLSPVVQGRDRNQFHANQKELASQYLALGKNDAKRESLSKKLHEAVNPKPQACRACHGDEPGRLVFEELGYSENRAEALRHEKIADLMNRILEGEPFHLPRIMLPGAGASSSDESERGE